MPESIGELHDRLPADGTWLNLPEYGIRARRPAEERVVNWSDIDPADAVDIDLTLRLDITAPLNEAGERCPWPWDPQQLTGAPLGQYHCPYCGAMVMAGVAHLDYRDLGSGAAAVIPPGEDPCLS